MRRVYLAFALLVALSALAGAEERALYTYRITVEGNPAVRIEADVALTADDMDIRLRSPLTGTTRIEATRCGMVWRTLSASQPGEKSVTRREGLLTVESTRGAVTNRITLRLEPTVLYPFPLLAGCIVPAGADEWYVWDPRQDRDSLRPTRLVRGGIERIELAAGEARALRVDAYESAGRPGESTATYWVRPSDGILLKWQEERRGTTYTGVVTGGV